MRKNASVLVWGGSCVPTLEEIKKVLKTKGEARALLKTHGKSPEEIKYNVTDILLCGAESIADALSDYLKDKGFEVGVLGEAAEIPADDNNGLEGCSSIQLEMFTNSDDAEEVAELAFCWLTGDSDEYLDFEMIDSERSELLLAFGWSVDECFDCWGEPKIVFYSQTKAA